MAKLSGYAADGVTLGEPYISRRDAEARRNDFAAKNAKDAGAENKAGLTRWTGLEESKNPDNPVNPVKTNLCASAREKDTVFDVCLAPDGKSLVVKFRERNVLPGIYSEVWTIPASDSELPEKHSP